MKGKSSRIEADESVAKTNTAELTNIKMDKKSVAEYYSDNDSNGGLGDEFTPKHRKHAKTNVSDSPSIPLPKSMANRQKENPPEGKPHPSNKDKKKELTQNTRSSYSEIDPLSRGSANTPIS